MTGPAPHDVAAAKRDDLVRALARGIDRLPDDRIASISNADATAAAMLRVLPRGRSELGELVGPVYPTRVVTEMLHVTRAAVSKMVKERRILGLRVGTELVFPAFQFRGSRIRPDVLALVRRLDGAPAWATAAWLRSPATDDDLSPLELLDLGAVELAHDLAREAAAAWAA